MWEPPIFLPTLMLSKMIMKKPFLPHLNIRKLVMNNEEFHDFTEHEKYTILKNHFVPDEKFHFPKKELHGCNQSYKRDYVTNSFVYSKEEDSVYCIVCLLFVATDKRKGLISFVKKKYAQWHNTQEKQMKHCSKKHRWASYNGSKIHKALFRHR